MHPRISSAGLSDIAEKVAAGVRLDLADGVRLFDGGEPPDPIQEFPEPHPGSLPLPARLVESEQREPLDPKAEQAYLRLAVWVFVRLSGAPFGAPSTVRSCRAAR